MKFAMPLTHTDHKPRLLDFASFGPETSVATTDGVLPIEWLAAGDKIITRDHGVQTLRWILRERAHFPDLVADPRNWPITIPVDAQTSYAPDWPLVISQKHHLLVDDGQIEYLFGHEEALATAKDLIDPTHCHAPSEDNIFYHLLFDEHQLILANGIWVESLFANDALHLAAGSDMPAHIHHTKTTRPCLNKWETDLLRNQTETIVQRHNKAA